MIPADHLLAFALIAFALIIVPGPNVLFIISRSLMLGRTAGVGTALGGQIGVYVQVAAVARWHGAGMARALAATDGDHRRNRRPGDDRYRGQPGRVGPQRLTQMDDRLRDLAGHARGRADQSAVPSRRLATLIRLLSAMCCR